MAKPHLVRPVTAMLSRAFFVLLICLSSARVFAQQGEPWGLLVQWPFTAVVNSNITYRIIVTNESTIAVLNQVFVTNAFSRPVQFVESTTTDVTRTENPNNITFNITRQINPGESFLLTLTVRATSVGSLTNNLTGDSVGTTVRPMGTAVTQVTAPVARSDLSVAITGPTSTIFVDDWVPYTITVSKNGPDAVSGVFLTNVLPTGAIVQGYSPSNAVTLSGQRVIFDLGTMSLASTQVNLTIQPTGTNVVLAAIVGTTGLETNAANNSATNTVTAAVPVVGDLTAEAITDQIFNRQNALFEQLIRVTYNGVSNVPSARVILSNFNHKVVNAVGTNDGNAFVVHAGTLSTNQRTADLILEYVFLDRLPKPDPDLITYSAGTIDLTPPTGTNVAITNIVLAPNELAADRVLLRFPATPGARYAITYATNMGGTVRKAMPLLVAQANYVHWIDYGPPKTISPPFFGEISITNDVVVTNKDGTTMTNMVPTNIMSMRFYQAIQLP